RLEYYLSDFSLTHDQGQQTNIPELHILADAHDIGIYNLGTLSIEQIESIQFSVGVHPDFNHLDPTTYPANNALAPQVPSMHWGWTAGYRFLAAEGMAGNNLNVGFEIHALGDQNYFSQSIPCSFTAYNNEIHIYLDAEYNNIFNGMDLASGVIEHSDINEAFDALVNMQSDVFSVANPTSIPTLSTSFSVFPNPSTGIVTIQTTDSQALRIFNAQGQLIEKRSIAGLNTLDLSHLPAGLYFISTENQPANSYRLILQP
ncbi:MAG: hypothetical protein RL226_2133, partial [Bacteroidota bacterium]